MLKYLFLTLVLNINCFSPSLINKNTIVNLHLEKLNDKYNLYHIGISFKNEDKLIRYDYRPFCEENKCSYKSLNTLDNINDNINELVIIDKLYKLYWPKPIKNITIFWGETNKSLNDIELFEKTLHKKYILVINDCRHYVNRFSLWALNKTTPIWRLEELEELEK